MKLNSTGGPQCTDVIYFESPMEFVPSLSPSTSASPILTLHKDLTCHIYANLPPLLAMFRNLLLAATVKWTFPQGMPK